MAHPVQSSQSPGDDQVTGHAHLRAAHAPNTHVRFGTQVSQQFVAPVSNLSVQATQIQAPIPAYARASAPTLISQFVDALSRNAGIIFPTFQLSDAAHTSATGILTQLRDDFFTWPSNSVALPL